MEKELIIKRCKKCGAIIKVINDCKCADCGIMCCNEEMEKLIPNSVDASFEKHIPTIEISGEKIKVQVNHVMEDEHYIEWVCVVTDKKECIKYFKSGEVAEAEFKYIKGSKVYAYCNKHGLWMKEIN